MRLIFRIFAVLFCVSVLNQLAVQAGGWTTVLVVLALGGLCVVTSED